MYNFKGLKYGLFEISISIDVNLWSKGAWKWLGEQTKCGVSYGCRNTKYRYAYTLVIRLLTKARIAEKNSVISVCPVLSWVDNQRKFKLNASLRYTLMGASLMQIVFITAFVTISDLAIFIFKKGFLLCYYLSDRSCGCTLYLKINISCVMFVLSFYYLHTYILST